MAINPKDFTEEEIKKALEEKAKKDNRQHVQTARNMTYIKIARELIKSDKTGKLQKAFDEGVDAYIASHY